MKAKTIAVAALVAGAAYFGWRKWLQPKTAGTKPGQTTPAAGGSGGIASPVDAGFAGIKNLATGAADAVTKIVSWGDSGGGTAPEPAPIGKVSGATSSPTEPTRSDPLSVIRDFGNRYDLL